MKYDVYWFMQGVEDLFEVEGRNRRQALRIPIAVKMFGRDGHGDIKNSGAATRRSGVSEPETGAS